MSLTKRWLTTGAAATVLLLGAQFSPAAALAEPGIPQEPDATQSSPDASAPSPEGQLPDLGPGPYNVVYRSRVDGASRGATISYAIADDEVNTANPTMVPGRIFETTGVVSDTQKAGMQVSIRWPYSASLHCEILVNDQIIAQADQFVAPRLTPQRNDPGYGVLSCGSVVNFPTGNTAPIDTPAVPDGVAPADPMVPAESAPAPAVA